MDPVDDMDTVDDAGWSNFDGPTGQPTTNPSSQPSFVKELYQGAALVYGTGQTFIDGFNADRNYEHRAEHPYYPFASRHEWELAFFLLQSGLSMAKIDHFLKLNLVCTYYYNQYKT